MFENFDNCLNKVINEDGFYKSKLLSEDLEQFRKIVQNNYLNVLLKTKVNNKLINETQIMDYHKIERFFDHKNLWTKKNRILKKNEYKELLKTELLTKIHKDLGFIKITEEDNSGYPEMYYRLVRPLPFIDTGPLHADKWFWDLGGYAKSNKYIRVKFWISLWNENKNSGFRYVPNSHNENFSYSSRNDNGKIKPVFDEKKYNLNMQEFICDPGGFILFNDNLLHGGFPTHDKTRVSLEFTLLVKIND